MPHLCIELKRKAMKKLIPLLGFLFLLFQLTWAQSNDLHVSGYVTDADGGAVHGHLVCVLHTGNATNIPDSVCGQTNANGWYSIVVQHGSVTGANQTFDVVTGDNCNNQMLSEQVQNAQGSVDAVSVDFQLSCGSSTGGGCNCEAQIVSTLSPNGDIHMFAVDIPCGTAPFQYQWWIDGHVSTGVTATHVFTQNGTYGVCVTVADANGCSFQTCDTVYVGGGGSCDAHFYYSSTPNGNVVAGTDVHFFFSGQGTNIATYHWTATGAGLTISSADMNPVFNFPAAGTYYVCVTADDGQGCTDTFCANVTAVGGSTGGCQAYFEGLVSPTLTGWQVHFTDMSSGTYDSWFWDFGDGHYAHGQHPVHMYTSQGTYTVCLTVIDSLNNQCYDDYCTLLVVDNSSVDSCTALFTYQQVGPNNGTFVFDGAASGQLVWDFGDGHSGSGQSVTHTFDGSEDWYWVCLTVFGPNSCTDTYCDTVWVNPIGGGGCNADFTFQSTAPSGPSYVFFGPQLNTSANYHWSFGDGTSGIGQTVTHQFPSLTGTYDVCLTVSLTNSQSCTSCQTITVGQNNCGGFLSGQVFAGTLNQPIDHAIVYLITYDGQTQQLAAMQATVADSSGYYYFQSVPCGDYLIKAAATQNSSFYSNHLPTYYGNSLFWQYAQAVAVNVAMPAVQYDIVLIAGNNPGGPGFIGGNVLQGANKVEADGEPLEGINVMLFDLTGNAIAYTYTDVNGEFSFDGLAYGGYQVYAEMLNYTTVPAVVHISAEEPMVEGLNIFVSEDLISTGILETDFESLIGNIYPNPASEAAALSINLDKAHAVNVMVVDLTGRTISSEAVNLLPGINTHRLSLEGLGSGYYMLRISEVTGAFNVTRRFIVNR